MKRALFLSPHLDDVVFSCGATLALWLDRGWHATVITVFTGNVDSPQGFALQCQTSKGIAPEVDYMALRRAEDVEAFSHLGQPTVLHWDFLEAPHRGYESPPELFAGVKSSDAVAQGIIEEIERRKDKIDGPFDTVFAPQGLGNHVDHLHVIRAACEFDPNHVFWYRDTPYAIREPDARASNLLAADLEPVSVAFEQPTLERKIAACCSYASQIGFQFGGPQAVREKLTDFHLNEAKQSKWGGDFYAEQFLAISDAPPLF